MRPRACSFLLALALLTAGGPALADSAQERYDKAAALIQEKKIPEAKKELEEAVKLDPKHVDARRVLAGILRVEKKPEAAAKHLEKAIDACEDEKVKDRMVIDLGNAYAEAAQNAAREAMASTKKRDELAAKAISAYEKALAKDPELTAALFNLGTMQALCERWKDADASLSRFVEKKPDDLNGWFNLAQAREKVGVPETTIAAWERFIALAKDDPRRKKDVTYAEGRVKALKAPAKPKK